MKPDQGISVIICSYNGEKRLEKTIRHLVEQEFTSTVECELILVNNNSTDNTSLVAETQWKGYQPNWTGFSVIDEQQPGLSFARQKGIDASRYEYVIFCDDDNWLHKHYVERAYAIITAHPKVAALGGQSTAVSSIAFPAWFEKSAASYAVGQPANETGDVTWREFLWGSGIVIRKSVYQQAYQQFPSLLTGRKGEALSAGEDSEMCLRFMIMGYHLYYSDTLKFQHFIAEERLNPDYLAKLESGFSRAYEILKSYSAFYQVNRYPLSRKISLLLRTVLKRILFKPLLETEKLNRYLMLGLSYKNIDRNIVLIKAFYNRTYGY